MSFGLGKEFSESTPNLCRFRCVLIIYLIRYELGISSTTDDMDMMVACPSTLAVVPRLDRDHTQAEDVLIIAWM
jgi:hypothetical protein